MVHKHLLACIGPRIGAAAIDTTIHVVLFCALIFSYQVIKGFFKGIAVDLAIYDYHWVVYTAVSFLYSTVSMAGKYQATIGQRLFGIKVQMVDGHSVQINAAAIRWLFSLVSAYCALVGYLVALFVNDRRTFHDYHSGTVVVVDSYLDSRYCLALNAPADRERTIREWPSVKEESSPRSLSKNSPVFRAAEPIDGCAEGNLSVHRSGEQRPDERSIADVFWEQALEEYEGDRRKKGVWARCYAKSNGDEKKTMAAYLQIRAEYFAAVNERQALASRRNDVPTTRPKTSASPAFVVRRDKYEKSVEEFDRGSRSAAVVEAKLEAVTGKRVTRSSVDEQILFSFEYRGNRYSLTKDQAVLFIGKRQKRL